MYELVLMSGFSFKAFGNPFRPSRLAFRPGTSSDLSKQTACQRGQDLPDLSLSRLPAETCSRRFPEPAP